MTVLLLLRLASCSLCYPQPVAFGGWMWVCPAPTIIVPVGSTHEIIDIKV